MNAKTIREAVQYRLPADSPYYGLPRNRFTRKAGPLSMDERLAIALFDPKFGWNVAAAYAESDYEMPADIHEGVIRRAYDWLEHDHFEEDLPEARALAHPALQAQADVVRALLLCRNISTAEIAVLLKLKERVVFYFEQLMFNVRDRLDEPQYIHHLLYGPAGRRMAPPSDQDSEEDAGLLLLRTGYFHGAGAVMRLAGLRSDHPKAAPSEVSFASLERQVLGDADAAVKAGNYEHGSVALARSLMVAARKQQPPAQAPDIRRNPFPSMGQSIISEIKAICGSAEMRRIQARLDAEEAAKDGAGLD